MICSGIYAKYHVQIMLLIVYTTTLERFVIFTCRYFKLSWNTTALSQSNCRNFSCSSINNEILHLNEIIKDAVVNRNYSWKSWKSSPFIQRWANLALLAERVRKLWKQLIDVHENSGFNWEKKPASRAHVSANRCKGEIRKSLKNRFYVCQFSHKTRKDAMATAIEGWTHKKHSLMLKLHRIIISLLLFTARSPKVWPLLIYSHSFVQI